MNGLLSLVGGHGHGECILGGEMGSEEAK